MPNILPEGITLTTLRELYKEAEYEYSLAFEKCRILDGTDKGRLWEVIGAKFPAYQILPDTNEVTYVKMNLLSNLYTVSRAASLVPTSEKDKDIVMQLNIALEHAWSTGMVGFKQMQAGERAALLNKGVTKVGWDNTKHGGSGDSFYKGEPVLENISPMRFMRDPYVDDIADSHYAITWNEKHKNVIMRDKDYKDEFKLFLEKNGNNTSAAPLVVSTSDRVNTLATSGSKKYYHIIEFSIIHEDGKMYEIHTIGFDHVLMCKTKMPAILPYSELFCNLPGEDTIGSSEPAKIFANATATNLIHSFALTAEYKNQRPPAYINKASGIDIQAYKRHGNDADHTFIVGGDPAKAVTHQKFPEISAQGMSIAAGLTAAIQRVTGVDGRYTGRDSGSILTTGGIDSMLDAASMIDQPKIVNYEKYSKRLTQLILMNMLEFSPKRSYFVKNQKNNRQQTITVDFEKIDRDTLFAYDLQISPILPKNKQRMAQMANTLMEKQMQYSGAGQQVDLITPEEWLMFQDLPHSEYMMERMGVQRNQDYIDQVSQAIFTYAGLTEQGVDPAEALTMTADVMQNKGQPQNGQIPFSDVGSPLPNQV